MAIINHLKELIVLSATFVLFASVNADAAVVRHQYSGGVRGGTTAAAAAKNVITTTTNNRDLKNGEQNAKRRLKGGAKKDKDKKKGDKKDGDKKDGGMIERGNGNNVLTPSNGSNGGTTTDSITTIGRVEPATGDTAAAAAVAEAEAPNTVNDWISTCGVMSRSINICAPNNSDAMVCKNCLKALSSTTSGQDVNSSGVASCARSPFCGDCTSDELRPFFACGLQLEGITATTTTTDTSSSSSTTSSSTSSSTSSQEQEPVAVIVVPTTSPPSPAPELWDLKNCPALYPRSGTECVIIAGFDYKQCFYYELGSDVQCQCRSDYPFWSCTGTIINNNLPQLAEKVEEEVEVVKEVEVVEEVTPTATEGVEIAVVEDVVEQEPEEEEVTPTTTTDGVEIVVVEEEEVTTTSTDGVEIVVEVDDLEVVVVDVEVDDKTDNMTMITNATSAVVIIDSEIKTALNKELQEMLCPADTPSDGDGYNLGGFDSTSCCYTDPDLIPATLGTIMCTCADDFGVAEFSCFRGSHSLCTVSP